VNKPLSLIVITLNEENNIERCLKSVPFASDIVVVDSGSGDQTVAKAQALGAKVIVEPFRGYGLQKNFAAEQAKCDWVLSLDGDEALSPELAAEIQKFLASGREDVDAFSLPRLSYHLGRWIRHGGWHPDRVTRLYHRRRAKWNSSPVHEGVEASKIEKMQNSILHWVFTDLTDQIETNNHYSTLGATALANKGQRFSFLKLLLKPLSKFIETYVVKAGFLDGTAGFVIAVGAAYSVFLKHAKLWEIQRVKAGRP
jgi:glycosyltransferase involved in cell wall biosynthesis